MPDELYCDIARQRQSSEVDQFEMILYYEEKNLKVTLKAGSLVNVVLPRFMALGTKGSYATYGLDPQENALRCGESYPIAAVDEKSYGILLFVFAFPELVEHIGNVLAGHAIHHAPA